MHRNNYVFLIAPAGCGCLSWLLMPDLIPRGSSPRRLRAFATSLQVL